MKNKLNLIVGIFLLFGLSCSQSRDNSLRVTYWKNNFAKDTILINNSSVLKKIENGIENSKVYPSKFTVNLWIEVLNQEKSEKQRIGINGKYFKNKEGQFLSNINLEEILVEELIKIRDNTIID